MSAQPSNVNAQPGSGGRLIRLLLVLFGAAALVALPVAGFFIGGFIGAHMAVNDIDNGYAYGGLLATVAQATHNTVYAQEANVSQALGITLGQSDVNTLSVLGLVLGLILDAPLAFLVVNEYEKLM
jgi:hypothetical protein